MRIRVEPTQGVLQLAEKHARTLLEYRGSFNRFDLRVNKVQAEGLAQLFFQIGKPRTAMAIDCAPLPRGVTHAADGCCHAKTVVAVA